jgi:hypothetical protein
VRNFELTLYALPGLILNKRPLAYRVVVTATLDRMLLDMIARPELCATGEKEGAPHFFVDGQSA